MTDKGLETKENRIHRVFSKMAFQIGFGTFFLGLGVQSSTVHAAQMAHYDPGSLHLGVLMADTALFLIGAAAITKGIKSLGKALMLMGGINPEQAEN